MAKDYYYSLASDGSKDFTTYAALNTQMVADWGTTNFDGEVVVEVFDTGDFTGVWTITSSLNPTFKYPLIIKAAAGHSPTIDASGNSNGIVMSSGPVHLRLIGIEVHGATANNIDLAANSGLIYLEDVYSHDCTADSDKLFDGATNGQYFYNRCRFEGTGYVDLNFGAHYFNRCSFSGGDVDQNVIHLNDIYPYNTVEFVSCKIDGSSLNAGAPLMKYFYASTTRHCCTIRMVNTAWYDGDYVLDQENANVQMPARLHVINCIFDSQDTGIFNMPGEYQYLDDDPNRLIMEANCYYNTTNLLVLPSGTYTTVAQLQGIGLDVHERSITTDPKLTIATGTIASDSPCIEAGVGGVAGGAILGYNGNEFNPCRASMGPDAQHDGVEEGDFPDESDVKLGVTFDDGNKTGSFTGYTGAAPYRENPDPEYLAATAGDLYTCPSDKQVDVYIHLCNTDTSARTVTLYVLRSSDTAKEWLDSRELGAAGSETHATEADPGPFTLDPGDKIQGEADVANKVFYHPRVKGIDYS